VTYLGRRSESSTLIEAIAGIDAARRMGYKRLRGTGR
jgi:hypothetical protein